jgi:hypothetical protein
MKSKAAIAYAAGKPLEVVTVELGGPKAGEVRFARWSLSEGSLRLPLRRPSRLTLISEAGEHHGY